MSGAITQRYIEHKLNKLRKLWKKVNGSRNICHTEKEAQKEIIEIQAKMLEWVRDKNINSGRWAKNEKDRQKDQKLAESASEVFKSPVVN